MNIEELRAYCLSLKGTTEDVKWGADLCFNIGGKMYCVTHFNPPLTASLKVKDEEFEDLCARDGIRIADYVGRYKWIHVEKASAFTNKEWKHYINQSYELIKEKLPKKIRDSIK